jgi:glycosyltransferase involved in cell wall biosynthesis
MTRSRRLINVFTPSDARADNTNAQNLTVKEIVARLPVDQFHVTMLCDGAPDPRLSSRKNTRLVEWTRRGNTLRLLRYCLFPPADIYFFPRTGPLDRLFFDLKGRLGLKTAIVTYIVMAMDAKTGAGMIGRSILEGDVIVGNSDHVSETIGLQFGVSAAVICDGVDRRCYHPVRARAENETPVVLYAGSFQPRKRVEMIIEQAARFPSAQFRLAGKGETEVLCRELAKQLVCRNVTFLGHLSSERLGEEMRSADIFLFPSILEGNPQVLLQAGASGLPAIAMEVYRSNYIIDGQTGFLARTDDELFENLKRLIDDPALRKSFGAAAITHTNQFDWDEISSQWSTVFLQAIEKRCGRPRQQAS